MKNYKVTLSVSLETLSVLVDGCLGNTIRRRWDSLEGLGGKGGRESIRFGGRGSILRSGWQEGSAGHSVLLMGNLGHLRQLGQFRKGRWWWWVRSRVGWAVGLMGRSISLMGLFGSLLLELGGLLNLRNGGNDHGNAGLIVDVGVLMEAQVGNESVERTQFENIVRNYFILIQVLTGKRAWGAATVSDCEPHL